jgi:hypothetical protein
MNSDSSNGLKKQDGRKRGRKRKLQDILGMPIMPQMCDSCPFNKNGHLQTRAQVEQRVLTIGSQTCHSTGAKYGRPDTHLCRGGRDFQLQIFYRLGFLEAPTDEAWEKRCRELNVEPPKKREHKTTKKNLQSYRSGTKAA